MVKYPNDKAGIGQALRRDLSIYLAILAEHGTQSDQAKTFLDARRNEPQFIRLARGLSTLISETERFDEGQSR